MQSVMYDPQHTKQEGSIFEKNIQAKSRKLWVIQNRYTRATCKKAKKKTLEMVKFEFLES